VSGIVGIVDFAGRPVAEDELRAMAGAAAYRGLDGTATWFGTGAALAHQARHVTPEAVREVQPLEDPATGWVLVADARIDNRAELLGALGRAHGMDAGVDDATLLWTAFRAWGAEGIGRVVGDFAFAVWDPERRRLFAARDALGVRPFVYRCDGRRFWFGSEVQQVLAAPGVPANLFEPAIAAHLVGRFEDHAWTPYEGVCRLPPGHALRVEDGRVRVDRFWDVDPTARVRFRSEEAYADAFRELFEVAVAARLRDAHPVGVLLSGGLDSGGVASMAGRVLRARGDDTSRLRTYSWAFDDLVQADERSVSDGIVAEFGFTATNVAGDALWPMSGYPAIGASRNGPFTGVYQELIGRGLEMARDDGVRTLLSGNRGDLLGSETVTDVPGLIRAGEWRGVRRDVDVYRAWKRVSLATALDALVLRPVLADLAGLPPLAALRGAARSTRRRRSIRAPAWVPRSLLARTGLDERPAHGFDAPAGLPGVARKRRYRTVFSGMQIATTEWVDTLYASHGLTFADPFSDRRLVEFVVATPPWVVQRLAEPKRLARAAMRGVMPEAVRLSARKVSPHPLFDLALRDRAVSFLDHLLTDPLMAAHGYVDPGPLRAHLADVRGGAEAVPTLWWALTLEMWLRRHHAR
jgi:asparagine synthase (glutamine-hydrolysing)